MRRDPTTPDTRLADDPMAYNPATVENLVHLMLGGLPPKHQGEVLQARVRYFDPIRRRPGLPEDVAALVDSLKDDSTSLVLVNLNPVRAADRDRARRRLRRAPLRARRDGRADDRRFPSVVPRRPGPRLGRAAHRVDEAVRRAADPRTALGPRLTRERRCAHGPRGAGGAAGASRSRRKSARDRKASKRRSLFRASTSRISLPQRLAKQLDRPVGVGPGQVRATGGVEPRVGRRQRHAPREERAAAEAIRRRVRDERDEFRDRLARVRVLTRPDQRLDRGRHGRRPARGDRRRSPATSARAARLLAIACS